MSEWEDFYQILQIHFMAEPEVIKGAYLKLCKKYHPDVNPSEGAEEKIKQINMAYEVLSNPIRKTQYLVKWFERHSVPNNFSSSKRLINPLISATTEPSKSVLNQYLNAIQKQKYQVAYELLSQIDQQNISMKDYIHWQTLVSEVFELMSFQSTVENVLSDVEINSNLFLLVVQIRVRVVEKNQVMGRIETDEFIKNIVFENNHWHVFLGYKELKSVIMKFDELAHLRKKKKIKSIKIRKSAGIDLYERKEFLLLAEKEQERRNRYGNVFSMILIGRKKQAVEQMEEQEQFEINIAKVRGLLRKLDLACRWKKDILLLLLPETDEKSAQLVVEKIKDKFEELNRGNDIEIYFMEQQNDQLKTLIKVILKKTDYKV